MEIHFSIGQIWSSTISYVYIVCTVYPHVLLFLTTLTHISSAFNTYIPIFMPFALFFIPLILTRTVCKAAGLQLSTDAYWEDIFVQYTAEGDNVCLFPRIFLWTKVQPVGGGFHEPFLDTWLATDRTSYVGHVYVTIAAVRSCFQWLCQDLEHSISYFSSCLLSPTFFQISLR